MIHYIKLGKVRGLSIEINKNFGSKPIFRKNSLHGETILDIPYGQLIFTSGQWKALKPKAIKPAVTKNLPIRRASNVNSQDYQTSKRTGGTHRD